MTVVEKTVTTVTVTEMGKKTTLVLPHKKMQSLTFSATFHRILLRVCK